MEPRTLAGTPVRPIGLGCMNLSHGYSNFPTDQDAARLLHHALDSGVDHLDTATLYGGGRNEELVGAALANRRDEFFLASKCGLELVDGRARVDGRPSTVRRHAERSLRHLRTDYIDLYYLHRLDKNVPVEESVGALSDLVHEGYVGAIGLSEVSAETLRRAHAVHPIAAVQTEYSPWTRNPELGVLDACRDIGATFVAFSPVGRGFFGGKLADPAALPEEDMRHHMPRFSAKNYPRNLELLDAFTAVARRVDATPAQLALAWVLARGEHVVAIPGTTSAAHLDEDLGAERIVLDASTVEEIGTILNQNTVHGHRYTAMQQATIDTEDYATA